MYKELIIKVVVPDAEYCNLRGQRCTYFNDENFCGEPYCELFRGGLELDEINTKRKKCVECREHDNA